MTYKNWLVFGIVLLSLVYLISLVSAAPLTVNNVALSGNTGGTNAGLGGMKVLPKASMVINSIKQDPVKNQLSAHVCTDVLCKSGTRLASANFGGTDDATFSSPPSLTAGTVYYFLINGTVETRREGASGGLTKPFSTTYLNWTLGVVAGGGTDTRGKDIVSVNITLPTVNVTLGVPKHNSYTFNSTIKFNATAMPTLYDLKNITFRIYNSTDLYNKTIKSLTGTTTNTTEINVTLGNIGVYTWNALVCGEAGGSSACFTKASNTTFTYGYVYNSETHSASASEFSNQTFILNATLIQGLSSNLAYLIYNNTRYNATGTSIGSDRVYTVTLITPLVDSSTVINWNWNITLTQPSFEKTFNVVSGTQNVGSLPSIIVQNTSCGEAALLFTMKDEQNFSVLSGDIQYNFKYGTATNNTLLKTFGELLGTTKMYVCINSTALNPWIVGSGEIFYTSTNYVERRYYLFSGQQLTNVTENVTLYNLISSDQTSFKLEVEDTSLNPYVNKFTALLRWYPQLNDYRTVEMGLTDEKGDTVIHVETEDVDYRIAVYEKNGSLIKLEDPTRMLCLINPCTYTLRISPSAVDYVGLLNIQSSFTYNATTKIWTYIFNDPTQKTTSMNLTVYKVTGTAVYPICSDLALGYTGVLSCNTSLYSGNFKGVVTRSASPSVPIAQKLVSTVATAFSSTFGLWLSLLIGVPIAFIFALASPIAAIVGGVIALLPAFYFGAISWAVVGGVAILGGIAAHFLKRIG